MTSTSASSPESPGPGGGSGGGAGEPHEEIEAQLSDYHEGLLAEAPRRAVADHLAGCPACRGSYEELRLTVDALSGLKKMPAPAAFGPGVEATIHRRSAGRFFGRRAFGDRVPFELLAVLALLLGIGVYFVLRSSDTGSLRYRRGPDQPSIAPGAREAVPHP
jgi:anti-sigma factor RsiW